MEHRPPKPILDIDTRSVAQDVAARIVIPEGLQEQLRDIGKRFSANFAVAQETAARFSEQMSGVLENVVAGLSEFALAFGRFAPKNWSEDADVEEITRIMHEEGYCLAWVPPAEIVDQMVSANAREEWDAVLETNAAQIVVSVRSILSECDEPSLQESRAAAEEAVTCWENGQRRAAQSLAASCLSHVVQQLLAYTQLAQAKKDWEVTDREELSFAFRLELLGSCLSRSLRQTTDGLPGFNRHATAHGVRTSDYSDANALNAVMLAAAWLREFQSEAEYERKRRELKEKRIATGGAPSVGQLRRGEPILEATETSE